MPQPTNSNIKLKNSHPGLFLAFGLRGVYFLMFGLQIAIYQAATNYPGYALLKSMLPMHVWGALWGFTGLWMLLGIVFNWRKVQLATCSISIFLPLIWGVALLPSTALLTYLFISIAGVPLIKEPTLNPATEIKE